MSKFVISTLSRLNRESIITNGAGEIDHHRFAKSIKENK